MSQVGSALRVAAGAVVMAVAVAVQMLVLLLLLPSRNARIRACNYWGKVVGPALMWISGCPYTLEGEEHLRADRPAIYICNHTSIYDIFFAIFLSPIGTVGVAKKQVIWYPFFGQMYLLSGHLRLDRGNHGKALASMKHLADIVRRYKLSIYIWPEGTRARDGRLLPFKKGIVHLAVETGLPIVPIVISGAHRGWEKGTALVRPVPLAVKILPPVDTSAWSLERVDAHLAEIWEPVRAALPEDQQPVSLAVAA
jgi:1-acyl-sn-glycerol-3-phosphate acyltransferase